MPEPLDEMYLAWLYGQVSNVHRRSSRRTHWALMSTLHDCEFVALVPNDDNRIEDIKELKVEFLHDAEIPNIDRAWLENVSFLELLVVLARMLDFETDSGVEFCFTLLLANLGLSDLNDSVEFNPDEVRATVDKVVSRTYEPNGQGGLFPLRWPPEDQREIDLWYQLNAYVIENE